MDGKWTIKVLGLYEFDLSKIPRPDRSGLISVAVMFFLLGSVGVGGGDDPDWRCLVDPSRCSQPQERIGDTYHVTLLYRRRGHGPKECSCHWDYKSLTGPDIFHYRSDDLTFGCEGDDQSEIWGYPRNVWFPYSGLTGELVTHDVRWHCE